MKVKNMKGFTLAELLIVMAIIVVLAAVAIPTFGKQLEASRESADLQALRNAYSETYANAVLAARDGSLTGDSEASQTVDIAFKSAVDKFGVIGVPTIGEYALTNTTIVGMGKATFAYSVDSGGGQVKLTSITTAAS